MKYLVSLLFITNILFAMDRSYYESMAAMESAILQDAREKLNNNSGINKSNIQHNVYISGKYNCDIPKYIKDYSNEYTNITLYIPNINVYKIERLYFSDINYYVEAFNIIDQNRISFPINYRINIHEDFSTMTPDKRLESMNDITNKDFDKKRKHKLINYPKNLEIFEINFGKNYNAKVNYDTKSFQSMVYDRQKCSEIVQKEKNTPTNRLKNYFGF